jgi:hypothetical protein
MCDVSGPRSQIRLLLAAIIIAAPSFGSVARADPDSSSTSKGAALLFARALDRGDMEGVKAHSVGGTDEDIATLKSLSDMLRSLHHMLDVMDRKFPNQRLLPDLSTSMEDSVAAMDEGYVGRDTATLLPADPIADKNPPTLRKVGTEWKVDVSVLRSEPKFAGLKKKSEELAKLFDACAKDVESGKYATIFDAYRAVHPVERPAPQK